MRRINAIFVVLITWFLTVPMCVVAQNANPYLPLWEHLPDGEPHVFEDPDQPGKYRVYIIGSHDVRFTGYCGADIHAWSAAVDDLTNWRDEGPIFTYKVDGKWDVMFAPDLVEVKRKDGIKEYYLYPHSCGRGRVAMVAKGSRPDGPFTPINLTADGTRTTEGSVIGFDPSVYVEYVTDPKDPDYEIGFRAYAYWGFQKSSVAELDQNTMCTVRPGTEVVKSLIPASTRYGELRRESDKESPYIYQGEDLGRFNFFEASSIRKVGNKYLMIYSGYSGPDYGLGSTNSSLRYAYGDTPLGPWRAGGVLVDSRAPVLNKEGNALQTTNAGHNTHGSIEQINGQWYVFYHRPPRGFGNARQSMVAPINIECDKRSVADGGKVVITAFDPYAKNKEWSAMASNGDSYRGAEVTSEGFNIFGLDPYQFYSAGYACYLSNGQTMQDSWDIWDNHAPCTNVKHGDVIGYKYFGFGGLKKDKLGLKAFAGTRKGNQTKLSIFLAPLVKDGFKVSVWIDGPWDNAAWKGRKLGEIEVPAGSASSIQEFTLDVSSYVDGLKGKHAIYLVAEGKPHTALYDFIGLGFGSKYQKLIRHIAPEVQIYVDGKAAEMPKYPVRSTAENGITGYNHYLVQVDATDTSRNPVITAKATSPEVSIKITQPSASKDGMVECCYKGAVKYFAVRSK